jgi:hypothetical protein
MASLYTRAADRKRLAIEAMHKLAGNDRRTSIPAPNDQVRAAADNRNEINGILQRWWAREDSNLQPDRYERSALTVELRAR